MRIKISIMIQRYLVDRIDGFDYLLHKESESHGGLPGPDRQQGGWRLWFLNRKQEKNRRKRRRGRERGREKEERDRVMKEKEEED